MTNLANKPVFPWQQSPSNQENLGMTFRQYAATHILAGMVASETWSIYVDINPGGVVSTLAKAAMTAADTLIAELEEDEGKNK